MEAYVVDAFTRDGAGGNPAGVVVLADEIPAERMQALAAKFGYSETAFVLTRGPGEHDIRFFTPTKEVDLCGHATIASYTLMAKMNKIEPGDYTMVTRSGRQRVRLEDSGLVAMTQNLPVFGPVLNNHEVAQALGLDAALCGSADLPIQIASTGLNKIFVPIASLHALQSIVPDLSRIEAISRENQAIGMYCYCLETLGAHTAHCRNFAPVVGIDEDSATGTSAAALSCVLHHWGKVDSGAEEHLVFEQGDCIGRPSLLHVLLKTSNGAISQVQVAGRATVRQMLTAD